MKVAILTNILAPYRIPLFKSIQSRVDELTILLMAEKEENRQWLIDQVPFKTVTLKGIHFKPKRYDVSVHINYGVIGELKKLSPDVVISGGYTAANLQAFLYCKLYGKKYVGWAHLTLQDSSDFGLLRGMIRRTIIKGSDGSIAESTEASKAFQHYGAKEKNVKTCLMPLDVRRIQKETTAFRHSKDFEMFRSRFTGPILLSIGQAIERKGYKELFDIYERVHSVRKDVSLIILGDGPLRPRFEKLAKEKNWDRVHFLGYIQSEYLYQYLAIADVFIFHTLYDPYGLVLCEAMSAGIPSASSIFAVSTHDLIEDGINGFKIDPRKSNSSSAAILKILNLSPDKKEEMGKLAVKKVLSCDAEPSSELIVDFIKSLIHTEGAAKRESQQMPVNG